MVLFTGPVVGRPLELGLTWARPTVLEGVFVLEFGVVGLVVPAVDVCVVVEEGVTERVGLVESGVVAVAELESVAGAVVKVGWAASGVVCGEGALL